MAQSRERHPDDEARPMGVPTDLPEAFEGGALLAESGGVRVFRARRQDGLEVVLRIEEGRGTGETDAELSVLAAVDHPGIARLVGHGSTPGGGRFVAREWVEGVDLLAWSSERPAEELGALVARLCPALEHLHRHGFVHADLKPENVLVTPDGRPVLCDFGLARFHAGGAEVDADEEDAHGVSGTLFSLSPEVLLGLPPTPASDLFALGAMLHRLVARSRRSAREFYSSFPGRSFLDAAGTDPEDLPVWLRDIVASLTARAPERRPRSAAVVGRLLTERLGLPPENEATLEAPSWPVGFGRDAWLAAWTRDSEPTNVERAPQWIRTPGGEDPRPIFEHMRVYAALRGGSSHGVDLAVELARVRTGVALDRWARALASREAGRLVLCATGMTQWTRRALDSLVRACNLERERRGVRVQLVCVSSVSSPNEDWSVRDVPPVDEAAARRFVDTAFAAEDAERRDEIAVRLASAAAGSAARADRVLARATQLGTVYVDRGGFRVRPGDSLRAFAAPEADADRLDSEEATLTRAERTLLDAAGVCGDGATPDEVFALAGEEAANAYVDLAARGLVEIERTGAGPRIRWGREARSKRGASARRAMHAARAEWLESTTSNAALASMHRFCADPTDAGGREFASELRALIDAARAEEAIELVDRLEAECGPCTLALVDGDAGVELAYPIAAAAAFQLERARAWCAIGRTDLALESIAPVESVDDDAVASALDLVLAHVASLRHETDRALELFDRAERRHASALTESAFGRIQLLHSLGRDEETLEQVALFDPRAREVAGELPARKRAYVESLAAMSMHRVGRVQSALETMRGLVGEVQAAGDVGLEAALHINLAIMERSTGSLEVARDELVRAIELYDHDGLVAGLAHARATLGGLLRELVELDAAEPLLLDALEMRTRLGDFEGATTVRGMLGLLLFERGHARAAIEALENTAAAMSGAQKRRFAPLLEAKAIEMRTRLGDERRTAKLDEVVDEADPRIVFAKARIAWMRGDEAEAGELAQRTGEFASSLKLARLADEVDAFARRVAGREPDRAASDSTSLGGFDGRIHGLLEPRAFDASAARDLAEELARRGRDDRAARLYFALAIRTDDAEVAKAYAERAEGLFADCAEGLTDDEAAHLKRHLLGEPDPASGDLARRREVPDTALGLADEIAGLLDINRQLLLQTNLPSLLGVIVENALQVSGAERGFLVLEEHGELRFDTALDSCRGDVAEPEFEVSASVIREALDRKEAVRVSNAVDDPLLGHRTSVVSLELRSILCLPFEISEDVRGAIYLDHRLRKGAFDDRAMRLCSLLADQAALAIKQMKRMQEIRNLNRVLEKRVVEREADLRAARSELRQQDAASATADLVGSSDAMDRVRELLRKAAPTPLTVLVTGESGTGKELAVRSLHTLSPRRNGPFVSESCAALPPSLIESELFGFRRGAFTGADRDHAGLFEQADGGTLFLDEIGEMPLDLQAKLLRVLETGQLRKLGDNESISIDVRLVAATNRDLEEEVAEKRFRADLYYRLNGIQIAMPPLSERTEDIPSLAQHFLLLEDSERRMGKRVLTALSRRPWPGNVRELRNEIARLCVLADGVIDDPDLISAPATGLQRRSTAQGIVPIAELERKAIQAALLHTGGDKRRAAELLGISRAKIYQRLKEWGEADG